MASGVNTRMRKVAMIAVLVGAAGSLALMLHAARRQQSRILMLIFGVWVLSPFIAALIANAISNRWAVRTRTTLNISTVLLTLGSLVIYGEVAFEYVQAKVGFVFLVVPLGFWLLMAAAVGTAALISGGQPRRGGTA
jgi:multisubunit Na+/H+ antiporter MnhG subunit